MSERVFIDTNVAVYLFDNGSPEKQKEARNIFSSVKYRGKLLISTQVLHEFYVVVTKKLSTPLDPKAADKAVQNLAALQVVQIDTEMIMSAINLLQKEKISFCDSLIIQSAIVGGAKKLYSEDLQNGRKFGDLEIKNPFA
ncbi:MAG: PIN domain-containing protein [Thermodesulfobacteriota bacterium]